MCGICGFYNTPEASAQVQRALLVLAARGKEAAGIYDGVCTIAGEPQSLPYSGSDHALGHVLHAMVGCVPQPLQGTGVLVANCEIYNWRELAQQHGIAARNDADLLLQLLDKHPDTLSVLEMLDGVYAFAYERDGVVTLARDLLGVKPLFYSTEQGFAFASERKALHEYKYTRELYPRTVLRYDSGTQQLTELRRNFFTLGQAHPGSYEEQRDTVARLLREAVAKRVPDARFGLLLSGGTDSSALAMLLGKPPCYVVGKPDAPDVIAAQELARRLELPLRVISPTDEDVEVVLPAVIEAIEDSNPVKVGVAVTMWLACAAAEEDGCRALFSGLGAEEIFAGYERHRRSTDLNRECLSGLRKLHERDLYRDDVITMHHGIELRLPYLDKALVRYALRIPGEYKFSEGIDKRILRDAAQHLGLPRDFAYRPKKAAQYGSGVMKQLIRLGKRHKTMLAEYMSRLHGRKNKRLASLLSTGKDSLLALHIMHRMAYDISCCITIESANPDSYMYHTPNVHLAELQAKSMRLPLITQPTHGREEEELDSLREAVRRAKEEHHVEGVITGALASQYQRERIEQVCDELGLTVFSPLWQMDQLEELQLLLAEKFSVVFIRVAAEGLDSSWLGRRLDGETVKKLAQLQQRYGVHPAGEGGEYESLVLDAPLFREKLVLTDTEIIKDGSNATLRIKGVKTVPK